jgi:signal transduction histidine kinase
VSSRPSPPALPPTEQHITVLLVEDNPGDARLIREALFEARGAVYDLEWEDRLEAGLGRLAMGGIDVVVLDLSLPESQGMETFTTVHAAAPHVPIVVLTGYSDETIAISAVHEGAQDFLMKGRVDADLLARSLRHAIERHRMAEELERARNQQLQMKDRFLSHVSHELRSPLTAIYQFVTIVLDGLGGDLTAEQREYLEVALRNVKQLRTMIADLLDATRAETGKLRIDPRQISIGEAVQEATLAVRKPAGERSLTVSTDVPVDLPSVYADPERIRQVLANLLDNAMKFTPAGGAIQVRATESTDEVGTVRVSVSDTGSGISPQARERIFDRLHQEPDATQSSRRGLGLGLYICRELVTQQGGRIWVESEAGQGSTFHFTLPVAQPMDRTALVVEETAAW